MSRALGALVQRPHPSGRAALFPENFVGVCQLPQSPGVPPANCIAELERCVNELGFVGCNLNPDPSGGYWRDPPLTDRSWYPLYEKMVELDVPAMVHVSSSCNPAFHHTGAHYLNGDTTAFMQFLLSRPLQGFPDAALHHPAWRRRGAVPLGPLSRAGAGPRSGRRWRNDPRQRLLRHLRLSLSGHRADGQGHPGRQHPVRLGDDRRRPQHRSRRPGTTSTTPSAMSTSFRTSRDEDRKKIFEGNARKVFPAAETRRWRTEVRDTGGTNAEATVDT